MVGVQGEVGAAVLQRDAGARDDDAGAEAHVVGLDEADHHAVAVGRAQVDRAARVGRRRARVAAPARRSGRGAVAA